MAAGPDVKLSGRIVAACRRYGRPVCHGLKRDGATIGRVLTTVPSRAEV